MHGEVNNVISAPVAKSLIHATIRAFAQSCRLPKNAFVSIALVGDSEIRKLNKNFLGKDKVTDVLSFSDLEYPDPFSGTSLGEVILSYPQAKRQAKSAGHSIKLEIQILLVHGLAHLLGYDHKTEREASEMERLEKRVLRKLQ